MLKINQLMFWKAVTSKIGIVEIFWQTEEIVSFQDTISPEKEQYAYSVIGILTINTKKYPDQ